MSFEIYFENLNQDTQLQVLQHFQIQGPEQLNFDLIPLAIINDADDLFDVVDCSETAENTDFETKEQMREAEMSLAFLSTDMPF